jgi:hypothetical protein
LLDSILGDVKQFSPHEQQDDITLVVARCEEDENNQQKLFDPAERFGTSGPAKNVGDQMGPRL